MGFAAPAAPPFLQGNYECAPSVLAEQMAACCRLQDGQLLLDGFVLHRQKNTYGPAQQAHILMRSLKALQGRRDVKEFAVIGEAAAAEAAAAATCVSARAVVYG
jgi:hypothetical protein